MRVLSAAKGEVVAVGFVPGRAAVVAAYESAGVFVWDLSSAEPPVGFGRHEYFRPRSLTFAPDGRYLVQSNSTGRVAVNLVSGKRTPIPPAGTSSLSEFAQTPDGTRLVMAHGPYYTPRLSGWHHSGKAWAEDWVIEPGEGLLGGISLCPTGTRLAHLSRDTRLRWPRYYELVIRDATTGAEAGRGEYPYSYRSRMLFRPDGGQLVAVHEMSLLVWPMPVPGKPRAVRNDSRRHFTAAAFHPSSRYLFTTSNDATVLVWDTATWAAVTRFTWNIGRLRSVAVSPDGAVAAAGSDKGQVVVWDVDL